MDIIDFYEKYEHLAARGDNGGNPQNTRSLASLLPDRAEQIPADQSV